MDSNYDPPHEPRYDYNPDSFANRIVHSKFSEVMIADYKGKKIFLKKQQYWLTKQNMIPHVRRLMSISDDDDITFEIDHLNGISLGEIVEVDRNTWSTLVDEIHKVYVNRPKRSEEPTLRSPSSTAPGEAGPSSQKHPGLKYITITEEDDRYYEVPVRVCREKHAGSLSLQQLGSVRCNVKATGRMRTVFTTVCKFFKLDAARCGLQHWFQTGVSDFKSTTCIFNDESTLGQYQVKNGSELIIIVKYHEEWMDSGGSNMELDEASDRNAQAGSSSMTH
ncbi:hypothetical protein V5O48_013085 [Marasmius crinis-equi]|uniref:Ubiquitin-like domain-containing protein n=1 Tax=Marasmius crinis-equi TaxID=585013 RepID=A0ABR3F170_9AGAR